MQCNFSGMTKGSKCSRCGRVLSMDFSTMPAATCRMKCRFLGKPTGESTMVTCLTCGGTTTKRPTPIYQCEVLGECLPKYRCTPQALSESMDRDIAVCRGCEQFKPYNGQ